MSVPSFVSQDAPELPGFARYSVDLASAELPCGASWIANVLLELGVPIFNPWGADTRAEWQALGGRRFRYQRADAGWTRLLPGLRHGREFCFRADPVPRLGHHWPGLYPALPTLLIVRDPRDALYSAWRRERALGALGPEVEFPQFLHLPFRHWPLSWSAYLALHTAAWARQWQRQSGLLLRFEDCKRDPCGQASRVLHWLGISASDHAIRAAVETSAHREVQRAEAKLLATGVAPVALLAGGIAEEWRQHYRVDWHAELPDYLWAVFEALGYRAEHSGRPATLPDAPQLTALAEQIGIPVESLALHGCGGGKDGTWDAGLASLQSE